MLNSIRNSLNKAQLRHLVWAGFALVLAILLLSNVTNISQLSTVQTTVDYVVDDVQPTLLRSQQLEYSIERAISAQNSYLLSQDVRHKESYAEASSEILAILEELKVSEIINQSERSRELLTTVEQDVNTFLAFKSRLFELAEQPAKNFPAMKFAAENINPVSQQILQNLGQMLLAEEEEEATDGAAAPLGGSGGASALPGARRRRERKHAGHPAPGPGGHLGSGGEPGGARPHRGGGLR